MQPALSAQATGGRMEGTAVRRRERERDADRRLATELAHYFEYSSTGLEIMGDGLEEMRFGEYLVGAGAISRQQLLTALMFQDRNPGVRIGECIAALGFA